MVLNIGIRYCVAYTHCKEKDEVYLEAKSVAIENAPISAPS